ncbi:hypothetical protein [Thermococcus aciditolerans]|nr:hypothetical protein [Thermococcus aciditolerans]
METAVIPKASNAITIPDEGKEGCEKKTGHERPLFDFELHPLGGLI